MDNLLISDSKEDLMTEEQHQSLVNSIEGHFALLQETRTEIGAADFQLIISQMDFLKTIASLVIGISAIGYFYDKNSLDHVLLFLACGIGIFTLILIVSITREKIDFHAKVNQEIIAEMEKRTYGAVDSAVKAIQEQSPKIFHDFSEAELIELQKRRETIPQQDYLGEVIIFLFYTSIGFLISSVFLISPCGYIRILVIVGVLVVALVLSISDWALKLFERYINPFCNKIFRKNITDKKI